MEMSLCTVQQSQMLKLNAFIAHILWQCDFKIYCAVLGVHLCMESEERSVAIKHANDTNHVEFGKIKLKARCRYIVCE